MPKKVNWKKIEKKLMSFWINKKKKLGLTSYQLIRSGIKERHVTLTLRRLRKEKKVIFSYRRWHIKEHVKTEKTQKIYKGGEV